MDVRVSGNCISRDAAIKVEQQLSIEKLDLGSEYWVVVNARTLVVMSWSAGLIG